MKKCFRRDDSILNMFDIRDLIENLINSSVSPKLSKFWVACKQRKKLKNKKI